MNKSEVILGLGSNVGNRRQNLGGAVCALSSYIENIRLSPLFESSALLPDGAPQSWDMPFYNMALVGETTMKPSDLLAITQNIEQQLGRNKAGHWSPREIDIDILAMGSMVVDIPALKIPHRELLKRDFALLPLASLAPAWVHPLVKKTAGELAAGFAQNELKLVKSPKLTGIINITPDSFSDGGKNLSPQTALKAIDEMIEDGADIIDIGAESTRPSATALTHEQEWERLEPVLLSLQSKVYFSIDTRHPQTAAKAIALGAGWVNDVSGFSNQEMVESVRGSDCKLVVMHSLSVPADKNIILPEKHDPVELIIKWAKKRFAELEKAGIGRERLIFDPGIGFGKNAQQSMAIINGAERFAELGVPVLFGHSRKSFLGDVAGDDATIKISQILADKGVDYLRVHNIKRHKTEVL